MEMAMTRSKWFLPGLTAFLGALVFVALWIGGDAIGGVYAAAVLLAFGLFVLLAGARSETIRGLRGDGKDERFRMIDVHATAFSGTILIGTLIVVARGGDGNPYGLLSALAGIAYLVGLAFMRWRS
jgi:hypothetical protein